MKLIFVSFMYALSLLFDEHAVVATTTHFGTGNLLRCKENTYQLHRNVCCCQLK